MADIIENTFKSDQSVVRALILSDSHGDIAGMMNIISHHLAVIDLVLFLGDGAEDLVEASYIFPELRYYAVTGNNDFPLPLTGEIMFPLEQSLTILGTKIYLTHGHIAPYSKVKAAVMDRAESIGARIALYGHLHVTESLTKAGIDLINPGSIRYPRGGSLASYAVAEFYEDRYNVLFYNADTHEHITNITQL